MSKRLLRRSGNLKLKTIVWRSTAFVTVASKSMKKNKTFSNGKGFLRINNETNGISSYYQADKQLIGRMPWKPFGKWWKCFFYLRDAPFYFIIVLYGLTASTSITTDTMSRRDRRSKYRRRRVRRQVGSTGWYFFIATGSRERWNTSWKIFCIIWRWSGIWRTIRSFRMNAIWKNTSAICVKSSSFRRGAKWSASIFSIF